MYLPRHWCYNIQSKSYFSYLLTTLLQLVAMKKKSQPFLDRTGDLWAFKSSHLPSTASLIDLYVQLLGWTCTWWSASLLNKGITWQKWHGTNWCAEKRWINVTLLSGRCKKRLQCYMGLHEKTLFFQGGGLPSKVDGITKTPFKFINRSKLIKWIQMELSWSTCPPSTFATIPLLVKVTVEGDKIRNEDSVMSTRTPENPGAELSKHVFCRAPATSWTPKRDKSYERYFIRTPPKN